MATAASTKLRPLPEAVLRAMSEEDFEAYEAALEGAYWARGKDSFYNFCTMVDVPGAPINESETEFFADKVTPAKHHRLLIDAIQNLADGDWPEVHGLMVLWPPGAAKSTYLSKLASSWLLGRKPGTNVIGLSYGQDLADRNARHVRAIARSPEFQKIMGCSVSGDNAAVSAWSLTSGSDYRSAGMTAGVTGFRADWALLDDPIKGREEADSKLIRDKVFDTFNDDVATRLKPGGKLLVCLTRWSEDDPAGRILGEKWKGQSGFWRGTDGRLWFIINLPLLAEHKDDPLGRAPGELLWPEWFRLDEAHRLRNLAKKGGTYARTWSSLYQQRPAPDEGAILARHYWREWKHKELPEVEQVYLTYDTAFEEGEENDYSAMAAWGVFEHTSKKPTGEEYKHKHVILLGFWQDKVSAVDLMDVIVHGYVGEDGQRKPSHVALFKPDRILIEKRASGIQLIQEMKRKRIPVMAWLPKGKPGSKGKLPRAHAIAVILEQGSVWYVPGPKTDMLLDQCAAFPYGTSDDGVDVCTMALAYFRDKFIFQTHEDELDNAELKEELLARADARRSGRSLYGARVGQVTRSDDYDAEDIERMTPDTRRKLWGST